MNNVILLRWFNKTPTVNISFWGLWNIDYEIAIIEIICIGSENNKKMAEIKSQTRAQSLMLKYFVVA